MTSASSAITEIPHGTIAMAARKLSGGDRVTKIVCKSGLAISWLIGIGITAFGIWSRATTKTYPSHDYYIVKPIVQEMLPLVLNLLGM